MAVFKKREHYYIKVQGQLVEVSEEVYRVWLLSYNQERRHARYFFNTYESSEQGLWKTKPSRLIPIEEYSGSHKLASDSRQEPENAFSRTTTTNIIVKAVDRLPDPCREVIKYLYFEDMTQEAAAKILDMSQPLLHYYKRKALRILRNIIESQGYSLEDLL